MSDTVKVGMDLKEHRYGYSREIVARTGMSKERVCKALSWLLEMGLVRQKEDSCEHDWEYRAKKDLDEWLVQWHVANVKCRMCEHEHVSVWPEDIVDETMQECPRCGHMTCEPISA